MAVPIVGAIARVAGRAVIGGAGQAGKAAAMSALSSVFTSANVPKVDISMFGDKELQRKLNRLGQRGATKVVRQALRKAAKRAKDRVVQNLSGAPVQVRTGTLRQAFQATKIAGKTSRGFIRLGVVVPDRAALGITDPNSFYPYSVEYGHGNVPAHPYIRPAIDDHKSSEFAEIGRDIGRGIEKEASRG